MKSRAEVLKELADSFEKQSSESMALTVDQIRNLPTNRFRQDLIEEMITLGLSTKEAELIAMRAALNLSAYDSTDPNFQRIVKCMAKTAVSGKSKLEEALDLENKDLWVYGVQLFLNF